MTDAANNGGLPAATSIITPTKRMKQRNAAQSRFKMYGIGAIAIGVACLVWLLWAIITNGVGAFTQTYVDLPVDVKAEVVNPKGDGTTIAPTFSLTPLLTEGMKRGLEEDGISSELADKELKNLISDGAKSQIRDQIIANPDLIGGVHEFRVFAGPDVGDYIKGRITREDATLLKDASPEQLDLIDQLRDSGRIHQGFNWTFLTGADASESRPEQAGMGVAMVGSLFMMLVVLGLALPIGVAASIYLEEFAPQNKITDIIEVNISNLAAVPSIVYGILGLAVFIQFGGGVLGIKALSASAPLVGGLVLTLMTLPTIIISTRAALKAVPPSIRSAALGVGASKMQSVFHHVLPLALPGILTGTIIGLAQALGETAPLLLIGMVGYVATNYPDGILAGFTDPNSAMPAQIYQWQSRADAAFYEKAWGGIIILLLFLMTMNIIAVILRRRFERRW